MKKVIALILLLCMVLTLAACGKVEITMQEIYDASQIEAMLQKHQSISIQDAMDGEVWYEEYLTEEYVYEYAPDAEFEWAQFMTDEVCFAFSSGDYLRYLYIAPDGVTNDFTSDRAELYAAVLSAEIIDEIIESATKKDDRITVNTVWGQEMLTDLADTGVTSGKFEYVLDAKTYEVFSLQGDYSFNDGSTMQSVTTISYDAEAPEMLEVFLKYTNQTEDLRNVTVVSNPGTEKEVSQSFQIPKGLIIGFTWDDAFEDKVELYADAACTESYDPYADTDSDLTIYVKWTNT